MAKPTAAGSPLPTASAVVTVAPGGAKAPWGGGIWGRDQSADYPWAQPQGGRGPLQESLNFRPRTGLVTAKGEADKAGAERPTAATLTWTTTLQLQTAWGTQA